MQQLFATGQGGEPPPVVVPSFEELYRKYFALSWRTLRALGVPMIAIDDAAQEVWFVVHRRLPDFEGRSRLETWLFAIALNVARNWRRAQFREASVTSLDIDVASAAPDAASDFEGREAWALVERFLATLDGERREVFVSGLLEGLSAPEVADVTGLDVATVYNRIRALRRSFRTFTQRERDEP